MVSSSGINAVNNVQLLLLRTQSKGQREECFGVMSTVTQIQDWQLKEPVGSWRLLRRGDVPHPVGVFVKIGNWEVTYFNRVPPYFIRGNILYQDLQRREKLAFLRNSRKIIMREAEEWGMNKNWVFMWVKVKSGRVSLSHIGELREFQELWQGFCRGVRW